MGVAVREVWTVKKKGELPPGSYEHTAVCHDHFEGSRRCVECKGPCTLVSSDIAYTALVRELLEIEAAGFCQLPPRILRRLNGSGVLVEAFRARAAQTRCT